MRQLLLISSEFPPLPGGIGTHAYQLAMGFTQNGYQVIVLTDRRSKDEDLERNFDANLPFLVHRVPRMSFGRTYLARIKKTFYYVKQNKEITLVSSGKFSLWIGALLHLYHRTLNQVAVIHGTEIKAGGLMSRFLTKYSLLQFKKIIAVSNFTKSKILEVIPNATITVITNGVEITNHQSISEIKKEGLRLITVGNVTNRKGQHNVISALPLLKNHYPDIHYDIVGLPTDAERLQKQARINGVTSLVSIHGVVSEIEKQQLILQSHLFLMLSEHLPNGDFEGFGIAVLEANALGVPAIGTRDSGIADAIQDGKTGILVDPHDPEEIKTAIFTVLNNYSVYSSNARNWAIANQWPQVISHYLKVIHS